mgnify:CR=1 FL=1
MYKRLKKIFYKRKGNTKKYKFFGITIVTITKMSTKKTIKICGITFTKKNNLLHSMPLVSIIVPNYNHAPYLQERLNSIYSQTYKNIEVILLDDCSSDNSINILQKYQKKYSNITRLYINDKNSGGVFFQWKKGLELAKGKYIWIAESDDWCNSLFLEKALQGFNDETVMLSFVRTEFIKKGKCVWTQEEYCHDISKPWKSSFIETAHNIVNQGFGYKNIIPNVSSAVFKNTTFSEILNNPEWYNLKLCGDWIFYLSLIKGGKIAYTSMATNYYRLHDTNTSKDVQQIKSYYTEHEFVSMYVAQNFKVSTEIFYNQERLLTEHWKMIQKTSPYPELKKFYNIDKIIKYQSTRKPNILMAIFAFSSGGGETFPIFLSNQLKKDNLIVTILNCEGQKFEEGVYNMLSPNIPVINLSSSNIKNILQDFGIDIIQTQHGSIDYLVAQNKIYFPKNCFHIAVLHGMYETIPDKILRQQFPTLINNVDRWLYIADKNLTSFKRHKVYDKNKFYKVANGLPSFKVQPISRSNMNIPEQAFVLCVVSRGIFEKGWCESIEAVAKAREISGADIHLVLVGNGEAFDKLNNKVPYYIHLVGFQRDTRQYFAMADMGLLASRFRGESFPLVVIDALLCHKPVIASNIGETQNMLTDCQGNIAGEIFELDNWTIPIEKLADIIVSFATNKKKYEKAKNIATQKSVNYDIKNISNMYQQHYHSIMRDP